MIKDPSQRKKMTTNTCLLYQQLCKLVLRAKVACRSKSSCLTKLTQVNPSSGRLSENPTLIVLGPDKSDFLLDCFSLCAAPKG